jgi:hypothetical protein
MWRFQQVLSWCQHLRVGLEKYAVRSISLGAWESIEGFPIVVQSGSSPAVVIELDMSSPGDVHPSSVSPTITREEKTFLGERSFDTAALASERRRVLVASLRAATEN